MKKFVLIIVVMLLVGCNTNAKNDETIDVSDAGNAMTEDINSPKNTSNQRSTEGESSVVEDKGTETNKPEQLVNSNEEGNVDKVDDSSNVEVVVTDVNEEVSNLSFEFVDVEEDKRIIDIVNIAYIRIEDEFDIEYTKEIKFTIYKDQETFWANTFGDNNNGATTGYGNVDESYVNLTSPSDTSIKSKEEMLKVPVHEMVHVLLPHGYLDIREGIAYYLADQLRVYSMEDIPGNLSTMITYQGTIDEIRMSYNLAGYKTKYIIEECLENNCVEYKYFMDNPDDFTILGYNSEQEFIEDLRMYLEVNAK